jgi:hypothetical protein
MSFLSNARHASENALDSIAGRFGELPRPVLALLGAGEMTAERLKELGEALGHSLPDAPASAAQVGDTASDLTDRAQHLARELASTLERLATTAPGKVQEFAAEIPDRVSAMPGKLAEMREQMSPGTARETAEAYGRLAKMIYGGLADKGEQLWTDVRSRHLRPGTVVEAEEQPRPARSRPKPAAEPTKVTSPSSRSRSAGATRAAGAPRPATRRPAAATPKPAKAPKPAATPHQEHGAPETPAGATAADSTPTVTGTARTSAPTSAPADPPKPATTDAPEPATGPTSGESSE